MWPKSHRRSVTPAAMAGVQRNVWWMRTKFRYKVRGPMMQCYVIMKSVSEP